MKKILAKIRFWWNYVVLKKERSETVEVFGSNYNKKDKIYYYKDIFDIDYVGIKEIKRVRRSRTFVTKNEYIKAMY